MKPCSSGLNNRILENTRNVNFYKIKPQFTHVFLLYIINFLIRLKPRNVLSWNCLLTFWTLWWMNRIDRWCIPVKIYFSKVTYQYSQGQKSSLNLSFSVFCNFQHCFDGLKPSLFQNEICSLIPALSLRLIHWISIVFIVFEEKNRVKISSSVKNKRTIQNRCLIELRRPRSPIRSAQNTL